MSTSDKDYIKVRKSLFTGRRVQIQQSKVQVLIPHIGKYGTVVDAKRDNIVPSDLLFTIVLDSGDKVAAGYEEVQFLDRENAEPAEGRAYA